MKVEDVLSVQKFWFSNYGVWNPINHKWFNKIYALLVNLILNYGFVFFMCLYGFFLKDLEDTVQFMYICLTEVAFLGKLTNFYLRQPAIQSLLKDINKELDICTEQEIQEIAVKQVKSVKQINIAYYFVSLSCVGSAYISPIFSVERIFPFPSYYPYCDWQNNNLIYGLLILFQVLGMTSTCVLNVTSDTVMSTQMCTLGFLYDILGQRLEKLGSYKSYDNEKKDLNDCDDDVKRLKNCIDFHKRILRCTKLLEKQFSTVIFMQFSISSTVVCVTAYQISIMSLSENFMKFAVYFFYILAMFGQFGLPCYFGNEIILKSTMLSENLFTSQWVTESKQFRRMMVIFMERLKRPAKLTAGRLFGLSLQTFTSIANSSYSFYAVLKKSNTK